MIPSTALIHEEVLLSPFLYSSPIVQRITHISGSYLTGFTVVALATSFAWFRKRSDPAARSKQIS